LDESGISDPSTVTVVGGIVADTVEWMELQRPWREHLAVTGASWFHAVDCEHGTGEFATIDGKFRESLIWGLSDALARVRAQCFGAVIARNDWDCAPKEIRDRCSDDPFYFCFELCLQQICDWSKYRANGSRVALVYSDQQEYKEHAQILHEVYRDSETYGFQQLLGSLTFADPRCLVQLQAADMVCYEINRHASALTSGLAEAPFRQAIKNFEDRAELAMHAVIHNCESLRELKPRRLR
ncbi:MAG: DUF3800 domain-containing protein, partial [Terriglobales bacterium]